MSDRLLLAVDGNSLLHRSHHAHAGGGVTDAWGRPTWALRGLVSLIASAAARLTPDALVVGFDCTDDSVRRADYPAYKAGRPDKHADLRHQLDQAPGMLAEAGLPVVVPPGYEADDVLASAAALARRHGWRCVVVTSDRDAFALIDDTTSVLRVLNGGIDGSPLLTPARLPPLCGVRAGQYRDFAALRGDSSDNLPGPRGIGPKTAARLLAVFDGVAEALAALDDGRGAEVVAAVGAAAAGRLGTPQARADLERNLRLMTMREDVDLPALPDLHLPVDGRRLRTALAGRGITFTDALWALTGGAPPAHGLAWQAERDAAELMAAAGAPEPYGLPRRAEPAAGGAQRHGELDAEAGAPVTADSVAAVLGAVTIETTTPDATDTGATPRAAFEPSPEAEPAVGPATADSGPTQRRTGSMRRRPGAKPAEDSPDRQLSLF